MKYVITVLVTLLLVGALVFILFQQRSKKEIARAKVRELKQVEQSVQKRFQGLTSQLSAQLTSFATSVASNRNFSLRLLVENDRSSPDITEMAVHFRGPMGFSVLEITDSAYVILSSGHFPASAGNRIEEKAAQLTSEPLILTDNVMGAPKLTMQLKKKFHIAEIPFYVIGGLEIHDQFLSGLCPREGVMILLKTGNEYLGKPGIRSISEVKDSKIFINDKEYYATQMGLPLAGGETASLIIVLEK